MFFSSLQKERSEWQLAYYITVGLQFLSLLFFCVFASGELQPWALHTYKHKYEQLAGNNDENEEKHKQKMLGFSEPGMSYSGSNSGSLDSVAEEKKKTRKTDDLMATLAASLVETLPDVEADQLRDPSSQPRSRSNTQQAEVIMYSAPADNDVKLESGDNVPFDYRTIPSSGERQQSVSQLDEILQANKKGGVPPTTAVHTPSPESRQERQGQGQYNHIPFSSSGQVEFSNTNGDGHLITGAGHNVGDLNSDPAQQKLSSSVATMQIHTSEAIGKRHDSDDVSPVSYVSFSGQPESEANHKGKGKGGRGKKSKGGKSSRNESSSSAGSSGSTSSINDKGSENESETSSLRRRRTASEGKFDDFAKPNVLLKPEDVTNGDGIHSQNSSSILTPVHDSLAANFQPTAESESLAPMDSDARSNNAAPKPGVLKRLFPFKSNN